MLLTVQIPGDVNRRPRSLQGGHGPAVGREGRRRLRFGLGQPVEPQLLPIIGQQVDARAERDNISNEAAKKALLAEKQPSGEFVTPEQLGALAVFFCSDAGSQIRGVAWNMDGGWTAQ